MDGSESVAVEDTVASTGEPQPESTDGSAAEISWGPVEYGRIRSVVAGGVAAVAAAVGAVFVLAIGGLVDGWSLSSETVIWIIVLLVSLWPWLLVYRELADRALIDGESTAWDGFRQLLPGWSWLRPGWAAGGAAGTVGVGWLLGGTSAAPSVLLPLLAGGIPLLFGLSRRYRLDPAAERFEFASTSFDQTWSRSLQWLVGLRRFDLGPMSLLVCSNRGKRWYEGVHFLPVPKELAPEVEAILRTVIDQSEPPERIDRDVRIIVASVGASMLGVGPLLYLVSGEPAVLLIIAGPSGLIAPGLLVHAVRA